MVLFLLGTAACENSQFYCENIGFKGQYIKSSRVNDMICGTIHFYLFFEVLSAYRIRFSLCLKIAVTAATNGRTA